MDGPPLVGDFDGSGNVQIAVNYRIITGGGTSGHLQEGVVSVLRLSAPYRSDHRDWPMYFHDARNSSTAFLPANLRLAKSGANLALSWPAQPDAAVVQYRDGLKTNRWSQLPDPPTLSNGLNTIAIPATNGYRWFRLQYP